MLHRSPARKRFRHLIGLGEAELPLAEAALSISWEDQGGPEPQEALQQLDQIAAGARSRLAELEAPGQLVEALNQYLFAELGFHGNQHHYSDPANSYLDRVLATRTGLPITLSVLYLEVGWRLGLPLAGVALPGHFLVCYRGPQEEIFVDPYHGGRLWSREECEHQVTAAYGEAAPQVMAQVLAPPAKRTILLRMLRNLKSSYIEREAFPLALTVADRILLIVPSDPQELRDRGVLRGRLGQVHQALNDLERYVQLAPNASDISALRKYALALTMQVMRAN